MNQEISKAVVFTISGLSELLTLQMQFFMQLMKERNSQLERLNSLIFDSNSLSLYLKEKSKSSSSCRVASCRKFCKKPGRTDLWWVKLNTGELLQEEWCKNLRIDINAFMIIVDELRQVIAPSDRSFRSDTISAEKKLAMCLYYLKDQGSFRMTANTFGVSPSTLCVILHQVCNSINQIINFPASVDELKEATNRFEEKFDIPQVIGCVDGTHIRIKKPHENSQDYYCYKQFYSLNCQAICDEKGFFIDVEVRWPGSVHDARVFHNCEVNMNFRDKKCPPYTKKSSQGITESDEGV